VERKSRVMTFGTASVLGMVAGLARLVACEPDVPAGELSRRRGLINHLAGGRADGIRWRARARLHHRPGNIGLSTLALGSFLRVFAIVAGAALTMKIHTGG